MRRLRAWLATGTLGDRVAIGFGVIAVCLLVLSGPLPVDGSPRALDALAGLMLLAAVASLVAGRRFPATVALALLGLTVVWYSLGYESRLISAPTLVAFYLLGATGDRLRQIGVGGLAVALLVPEAFSDDAGIAIAGIGWTIAAILGGELVRSRKLRVEHHAARADRAEAERDAEGERRVAEERLRIARDVHDVLPHTVAVMTVQAGVADDAVGRDLPAARSALAQVRSAGREALAEVRATVAALRGTAAADTAPAPGLDRVAELVDGARARGLDAELSIDGDGADVERLVELTAYRVVQESLTNVIRHADASRARVRIARTPSELQVEVDDNGRAAGGGGSSAGFGLRGMGERVEALGGALSYGPALGGGWVVRATLPTRTADR